MEAAARPSAPPRRVAPTNPFTPFDLGRFDQQGRLYHLGRQDARVKIRGYRVELGEVEAALLELPDLAEATVVAQTVAGDSLLATRLISRIRDVLQRELPLAGLLQAPTVADQAAALLLLELTALSDGRPDRLLDEWAALPDRPASERTLAGPGLGRDRAPSA